MNSESRRMERVTSLRRAKDKNLPARAIGAGFLFLTLYSWISGELRLGDFFTTRRGSNLRRYLSEDALPEPLRASGSDLGDLLPWLISVLREHGAEALLVTFWISLAAMSLAGIGAFLVAPFGCRPLFQRDPYGPAGSKWLTGLWINRIARTVWVILRAVPEYVWAFFLLASLGANAWPAVLALAIHNGAIMARLGSDTLEDVETPALRPLRAMGASRGGLLIRGLWPSSINRYLLYVFYRFEVCVREATVLGMLGITSLGYWIVEARSHQRHDEVIALVLLGALLVIAVDLASVLLRRALRRA